MQAVLTYHDSSTGKRLMQLRRGSPMHIWQGRKPLPLHCVHGVAVASCGGTVWCGGGSCQRLNRLNPELSDSQRNCRKHACDLCPAHPPCPHDALGHIQGHTADNEAGAPQHSKGAGAGAHGCEERRRPHAEQVGWRRAAAAAVAGVPGCAVQPCHRLLNGY